MKKILSVSLLVSSLLLVSCNQLAQSGYALGNEPNPQNGERIYFTANSGRRNKITHTGGPKFGGMMMGEYLTCAACHGPEGYGGIHRMHMAIMDAPDIRYSALNTMPEMQQSDNQYGLEYFKLAVVSGQHPDGEQMDSDMPRWSMSDADLQDLFAFIKILQ